MTCRFPLAIASLLLTAATQLRGQNTVPHWSSYVGGAVSEEVIAVRHQPNGLVTVVGHTDSSGLATPGAFQQALAGGRDVFVARFDPRLPPGAQLVWCTYLGGTGLDLAFDAEVDPNSGQTVVVGLTQSVPFPGAGNPTGPSDGFVAWITADGATLSAAILLGGGANDRLCEVEIDAPGLVTVAGVTEAPLSLPSPTNTYRGGATDAFVARIAGTAQPVVIWSTYVGGNNAEGLTMAAWSAAGLWWGNLDRMALTCDAQRNPILATASNLASLPAPTACAIQSGIADVYVAQLDQAGGITPGRYFGGNGQDDPSAIAVHPGGGVVIGGVTWSTNLATTPGALQPALAGGAATLGGPSDGFLCWLDPTQCTAPLRYCTYLGGNAGQDMVTALAIESSGIVTAAGHSAGGTFRTTNRCLQPTLAAGQYGGIVCRIALAGLGTQDLEYSSFVGTGSIILSVVLDNVGDAWLAGANWLGTHPVVNAVPPSAPGSRDGIVMHLPLLAGGISRQGLACATPACGVPLYTSAGSAPAPGQTFVLRATGAPPSGVGALLLGLPQPCTPVFNVGALVAPMAVLFLPATTLGSAAHRIPVPSTLTPVANWGLGTQWLFLTNPVCPGSGLLAASERLAF